MKIFYDSGTGQVEAVHSHDTTSKAWDSFAVAIDADPATFKEVMRLARSAVVTVDGNGKITGVTENEHPDDKAKRKKYEDTTKYSDQRRSAYFEAFPIHAQLEAMIERERGDSTKWDALLIGIDAVKSKFPKPT